MTFSSELRDRMAALGAVAELDVARAELPQSLLSLSDAAVHDLIADVGSLARDVGLLQAALAGVAARRSGRERGAEGLSVATGHRTPVELVQAATGVSRAEATRAVRLGESLLDGVERRPGGRCVACGRGCRAARGPGDVGAGACHRGRIG